MVSLRNLLSFARVGPKKSDTLLTAVLREHLTREIALLELALLVCILAPATSLYAFRRTSVSSKLEFAASRA